MEEQSTSVNNTSHSFTDMQTMLKLMFGNGSDKKSFEDSVDDSYRKISDSVAKEKCIKDSYGNSLLSIGNDDKTENFSNYTFTNDTLNWPLWLALYNESWVFKRAIDKPSQDEIRCGITLEGTFEHKDDVYKELKKYRDDLIELRMWSALFGGSVMIMMFDNFENKDYETGLNEEKKNKIRKCKSMKAYVVDRWYGVAPDYDKTVTKMTDQDYGKPMYYDITMPDGKTYRYHHDYVIRSEGRTAPKLIKNGMLQGWGYSEGSHILNELSRDEKLKSSIQSLVDKSLIEVIKMSGMRGIFMGTDSKNEQQLRKRLEMVNWGRNYNSLTFLDKEDEYQEHGFSGLGGLSDLLQQNMWQISAALEMQGVLFGDMKQGFSTDVDALERYDEVINGRCESYVRKIYEKLLKFIFIRLGIDANIEFTFNSLLVKRQSKDKIEALQNFVSLCSNLLNDGVLDTKLYAKALQQYSQNSTIDFGLTNEYIDKLDDKFENEMENIKIENDLPDLATIKK